MTLATDAPASPAAKNGSQLTLAFTVTDRTRPLMEGAVTVPDFNIVLMPGEAQDVFKRTTLGEFAASEMSMATHIVRTARGDNPYLAIPVFLSRTFRHSCIYIRTDRGIRTPSDLKGKIIGLREYQQTAALWVRGILSDQYGVDARDVAWRTGGLEKPGGGERLAIELPPDIKIAGIDADKTLSGELESGGLDALITPNTPSCFGKSGVPVVRLFPEYRDAELAYWRKTRFFPIMHVVVVRKDVVAQHPGLPAALFKAFSAAKRRAMRDLDDLGILRSSLPWLVADYERTRSLMGANFWSYGYKDNRAELDAMVRYAHADGLASRTFDSRELFVESTLALEEN